VTKNKRANWPSQETDKVHEKRLESTNQRVGIREEQFGEHEGRNRAVEKEIVPFNRGSDRTGDDRFHQHSTMLLSLSGTDG
jgi:hypothetical protein